MSGKLAKLWKLAGLALVALATPMLAQSSKPAAVVNGEPIPMSEIDAVLSMRSPELFPVSQDQQRQMRLQLLDGLIAERLMRQFLTRNGPPIDSAEIDKQMAALAEAQRAAGKTLAEFCKESHQTEAQVRAGVHNMLQFAAYAKQQTTEEQLRKYFQANLDYFQKVTVRVSHIIFRIPLEATEQEKQEARKKLTDLRQRIIAKEISFTDAAKQYSQCPSAPKGGDIGFIARKWMVDESIARAAFAGRKGELSDVIESEMGLHLLLVTERTDPKPAEFAACADDVRDCCIEEMRERLLTDLRKAARIEIHVR